jgi:hypothetical protein
MDTINMFLTLKNCMNMFALALRNCIIINAWT